MGDADMSAADDWGEGEARDLIAELGDLSCTPEEQILRRRKRSFNHWLHTSVGVGVSSRGTGERKDDVEKISKTYDEGNEQQRTLLDCFRYVTEETKESIERMHAEVFITTATNKKRLRALIEQVGHDQA